MSRPYASCTTNTVCSPGMGNGRPGGNLNPVADRPNLRTGRVISVNVNAGAGNSTADYWTVTIQPTGTSDPTARIHADCLFTAASDNAGASGVPRVGTQVYFLQIDQTTVCLGAMYTNQAPAPWPNDPALNSLRSTGLRIPDLTEDGQDVSVSTEAKGLMQKTGLLVSGTTWWPAPETSDDDSGEDSNENFVKKIWSSLKADRDLASPGHKTGLEAIAESGNPLPFNEVGLQSRRMSTDKDGKTTTSDSGGVNVYGQDFISQTTHGSIASTAIGNISTSAGGNVHIEASNQISLQVGATGITITEGGVEISQNSLAAVGSSSSLSVGQTSISMFGASIKASSVSGVSLQAMGSAMKLSPLKAELCALNSVKCVSGWYNLSFGDLAGALKKSATAMGKDLHAGKSVAGDARKLLDGTLAAIGLPWNMAGGTPWAVSGTLPTLSGNDSWYSLAMALKDVLVPAGTKLAKATAKGQASGFIATGNEAYMLGGFYMKDPKPKPGKLDKLKKKAKDAVMSKLGKAPKPKEPDPLEEASKSAFGGKRILLPVCNDAESGRCLTLSGGSTESKVQLFSTEMAASLESMDAAGAERFSGGHGVLTPFFALASLMWTKGAAAAAMAKKYASRRSDSVGNTDATTGNAIEMTPMTTRETANREEMTATTEEAVAATLEE